MVKTHDSLFPLWGSHTWFSFAELKLGSNFGVSEPHFRARNSLTRACLGLGSCSLRKKSQGERQMRAAAEAQATVASAEAASADRELAETRQRTGLARTARGALTCARIYMQIVSPLKPKQLAVWATL